MIVGDRFHYSMDYQSEILVQIPTVDIGVYAAPEDCPFLLIPHPDNVSVWYSTTFRARREITVGVNVQRWLDEHKMTAEELFLRALFR